MPGNELKVEDTPIFTRGKLGEVRIYDVTESELDILERGSPNSIFLNFALVLIPTGLSFLIALNDSAVEEDHTFILYTLIVIISFVGGTVLLALWLKCRNVHTDTVNKIRSRMKEEPESQSEKKLQIF